MIETVPDDLVAFAGRLADASGFIAKRYFRRGVGIETKPDKSPVTLPGTFELN